jgi:transcriptional regulator with XRE-family HTH domain
MRNSLNQASQFGERLRGLLKAKGMKGGPGKFSREFNVRYVGCMISTQCAGTWLRGECVPQAPRLQALAEWLDTTPAYLLFGDISAPMSTALPPTPPSYLDVLSNFAQLDPYGQKVIRELMRTMLTLRAQHAPDPMLQADEARGFEAGQGGSQP